MPDYSGPFEALIGLLARHSLDLTELSLSAITEEFLAYVRGMDVAANLDEASSFLDVASVLVEAKSAALLPSPGTPGDGDDAMQALRERDLLFARLLQYQAFARAAEDIGSRLEAYGGWIAHPGSPGELSAVLPRLEWTVTPMGLAQVAARVLSDSPAVRISAHRLHEPLVDLRAEARLVRSRLLSLSDEKGTTFDELCADASSRIVIVARFLAVLVFLREGSVQFRQKEPFGVLHLRCSPEARRGRRASWADGPSGESDDDPYGGDGPGGDGSRSAGEDRRPAEPARNAGGRP
ncbi:ScpA family protein [uncultured Bifidobacterium sp.]|uniref:segregation and condensation protein A n=1 Tax=uncultured Bifidobacterium sp. TaxID=165187 RepID=UPI0028DB718A|nr:ScpA family protein [uncultured Bifidobacterium sp.]